MTNFDFLLSEPQFASFANVAVSAENLFKIDCAAATLNCRRALEFAVKWMYSADKELEVPDDERLSSLIDNENFRKIVDSDVLFRMERIKDCGNAAAHDEKGVTEKIAERCIKDLFYIMDYIAYCYADEYEQTEFNDKLLELTTEEALAFVTEENPDFKKLLDENKKMKEMLTKKRIKYQKDYKKRDFRKY